MPNITPITDLGNFLAHFGNVALMIAMVLTFYGLAVSFLGGYLQRPDWIRSGRRAALACFTTLTLSVIALLILLGTKEMGVQYVQRHTSHSLPLFYRLAALWAGMEGSLMLWGWMLMLFAVLCIGIYWNKHQAYMPYVIGACLTTSAFFLTINFALANPFEFWAISAPDMPLTPFTPDDGEGLNPQLQHWAMVVHPPTLYAGYVGTVIPFAFAIAALLSARLGNEWIKIARRWILVAWLFLTAGILLGAKWAYVELGWGGYWAWDPVENASFMPWLAATALVHSIQVQERRGMLKVWNMILVLGTYILCIFGTFLTRSGIIQSVHTFAESPVGWSFMYYLFGMIIVTGCLVVYRLPELRAQNRIDSYASRESAFLFNNVILIAACAGVFFGTMYPVISEAFQGEKVTVGPPFFNYFSVPAGLLLLLLTGIGPLLAWRKTTFESMKHNFLWPILGGLLAGVVTAGIEIAVSDINIAAAFEAGLLTGLQAVLSALKFSVVLSVILCTFVLLAIAGEFWRGTRARRKRYGESISRALYVLTRRNTRRYGGYLVHIGVVLVLFGITGTAYNTQKFADLQPGQSVNVENYSVTFLGLRQEAEEHYTATYADLRLYEDGENKGIISPFTRRYRDRNNTLNSEVYIRQSAAQDLYVNFAGITADNAASLRFYVKPLVMWIWVGGVIIVLGTLVALSPTLQEKKGMA